MIDTKIAAEKYISGWRLKDFSEFYGLLDDNCAHSSQYNFNDIKNKNEVIALYNKKSMAVKNGDYSLTAQLARFSTGDFNQSLGDFCVYLKQDGSDVDSLVSFKINAEGNKIIHINILMPGLYPFHIVNKIEKEVLTEEEEYFSLAREFEVKDDIKKAVYYYEKMMSIFLIKKNNDSPFLEKQIHMIFESWLEHYPDGIEKHEIIDCTCCINELCNRIYDDKKYALHHNILYEMLAIHGVRFFAPGGSYKRRYLGLINAMYNQSPAKSSEGDVEDLLELLPIRIILDLLIIDARKYCQDSTHKCKIN